MKIIMRPLFNQENKMRLINQQLYKRRKIALKKLRIQQQQQQRPITININTGFETNRRIKEIYKKLELLAPQEIEPTYDPIAAMLENEREQAERMESVRVDDEAQELLDLAEEERQNDIAVAEEEKQMKIEEDEEDVKIIKKTETLTPRELRLNAALKRQKLLNRAKEKDKRNNLKELVLMNLNDKITNSLFG